MPNVGELRIKVIADANNAIRRMRKVMRLVARLERMTAKVNKNLEQIQDITDKDFSIDLKLNTKEVK